VLGTQFNSIHATKEEEKGEKEGAVGGWRDC
jgi:hypothetical protein